VTHDIPEAVYLADEIIILDTTPGCVSETMSINLPKDRTKDIKREPKFVKMVYDIEDKMAKLGSKK
jgi:ABC-type nitrate/sulfonate/bicarbonate transport system ATPase subunit